MKAPNMTAAPAQRLMIRTRKTVSRSPRTGIKRADEIKAPMDEPTRSVP